jgi:hypothetical protein
MSACCHAAPEGKAPTRMRKAREILAWACPSALLVFMPKCPVCLAAYVALWSGLGLSLTTATYLRWALIMLCVAALLFLTIKRRHHIKTIFNHFKQETESCPTK